MNFELVSGCGLRVVEIAALATSHRKQAERRENYIDVGVGVVKEGRRRGGVGLCAYVCEGFASAGLKVWVAKHPTLERGEEETRSIISDTMYSFFGRKYV